MSEIASVLQDASIGLLPSESQRWAQAVIVRVEQLSEYLLSSPAAVALLGAPAWAQQQLPRAALLTRRADQR